MSKYVGIFFWQGFGSEQDIAGGQMFWVLTYPMGMSNYLKNGPHKRSYALKGDTVQGVQ